MLNIHRRRFALATGVLLACPLLARSQSLQRQFRVGVLASSGTRKGFVESPLTDELKRLGFEEGKNLLIDYRSADGDFDRLPGLAADLVAAKPDVIVCYLNRELIQARRATSTIPIVVVFGMAPVELGLAASLARPGSNVTGTLIQEPLNMGKHLQIMRDIFPHASRHAVMYESAFPGFEPYMRVALQVAESMGIKLTLLPINSTAELDAALTRIAKERPDAFSFSPTGPIGKNLERLLAFSAREKIPAISTTKGVVNQGALYAFEPDLGVIQRRTASIIAKVLNGGSPAEIPIEQPTIYELWINMKTANALGLTIPPSVLLRVDRVIE